MLHKKQYTEKKIMKTTKYDLLSFFHKNRINETMFGFFIKNQTLMHYHPHSPFVTHSYQG